MTHRHLPIFLCACLAACGRSSSGSTDSVAARASSRTSDASSNAASTVQPGGSPGCPRTGKWALCSIETRLIRSGFVVRQVSAHGPRRAGFSVAPALYTLGRAKLELFLYPDEGALKMDMAGLDTITVSPPGKPNAWWATPVLVRSGNLAAVYLGDSPVQADRFTLAITAGAPQPGSSR